MASRLLVARIVQTATRSNIYLNPGDPGGGAIKMTDAEARQRVQDLKLRGFTKNMTNLDEVGPVLLAHLRDVASVMPSITPVRAVRSRSSLSKQRILFAY